MIFAAPPSACQDITIEESTSYDSLSVRWNRPLTTGREDFYYDIFYRLSDDNNFVQHNTLPYVDHALSVSYSIDGLSALKVYIIKVIARNGVSSQHVGNDENAKCEIKIITCK